MNNSKIGWRTVVVLAVLAISIWSFWPTVRVHSLSGQEKTDFIKNNPKVFKGAGHYSAHALAFLFALNMLTDDFLERMDSVLTLIVWFVLVYMIETTKTEKP